MASEEKVGLFHRQELVLVLVLGRLHEPLTCVLVISWDKKIMHIDIKLDGNLPFQHGHIVFGLEQAKKWLRNSKLFSNLNKQKLSNETQEFQENADIAVFGGESFLNHVRVPCLSGLVVPINADAFQGWKQELLGPPPKFFKLE